MRVLHLLHRSVPGTHGYAVRSREIVTKQLEKGLEPLVITSPSQSPEGELDSEQSEFIDGIRYFRTCSNIMGATREVRDGSRVRASLRIVQNVLLLRTAFRVAAKYRPAVIHGHSPFTCGLVADTIGRIRGIPSVYEMRGIWEDSHNIRHGMSEKSLEYRTVRFLENSALKGADLCCAICDALRAELISRGISGDKIIVTPNGVDVKAFVPGPPSEDLRKKLGLRNRRVMGYIGTFFRYEGLELLVDAMVRLLPEFPDLTLMFVGHGELAPVLKETAADAGVADRVVFPGQVPYREVADYYRLFDFMVLPRRDARETRLVTPLKPMEIMAMAKPLIASSIGGHLEIVEDGVNGLLFRPDDVADLVSKCRVLLNDREMGLDLGARSRRWVEANRDWNVLVQRYLDIYERLTSARLQ